MKILQYIEDFKSCEDLSWVGNEVLYKMCREHRKHIDKSEIIAKVWIIGRSYAVSIERGKKEKMVIKTDISDNFFKEVADIFIKKKLDELLSKIGDNESLTEDKISVILETHKKVMQFIHCNITGDNKRSFVSKYLHFHFPELFFIYDSRVAGVIDKTFSEISIPTNDMKKLWGTLGERDDAYARFFVKCFYFWKFCKNNGVLLSIRQIDSFLIHKSNEKNEILKTKEPSVVQK